MAARATSLEVTDTPARVAALDDSDGVAYRDIVVKNTGSGDVYLGGSDVDSSGGWKLAVGDGIAFNGVKPGDIPYAVVASGTGTLAVLESGV